MATLVDYLSFVFWRACCRFFISTCCSNARYAKSMKTPSDLTNASKYLLHTFLCLALCYILFTPYLFLCSTVNGDLSTLNVFAFLLHLYNYYLFLRHIAGITDPIKPLLSHNVAEVPEDPIHSSIIELSTFYFSTLNITCVSTSHTRLWSSSE